MKLPVDHICVKCSTIRIDGSPALVLELHEPLYARPHAVVSIPGIPHLAFNVPQDKLRPTPREVPHKVWTGEQP